MSHSIQNYQQYDQSRKAWTKKVAPLFEARYQSFFGVSDDSLYDIENAIGDAYQRDAPLFERLIQVVDYAGADKIITAPKQTVMIAERTRKKDLVNGYRRDPSLRFRTDGDRAAPIDKWLEAYRSGMGFFPNIMSFGVVEPGAGRPRLSTFALIAMRPWLAAIDEDRIDTLGTFGTNARYYSLADLSEIDAVLYEE